MKETKSSDNHQETDTARDRSNGNSVSDNDSVRSHASSASSSKRSEKKKLGKYGSGENSKASFRLSPEEQELAYELKASLMRKLDQQNAKINSELEIHRKFQQMKKQERAKSANPNETSDMSRMNAIKLMKLYEKNSIRAEARIKELEKDLEISQDLARRYHAMYMRERENNPDQSQSTSRSDKGKSPNRDKSPGNKQNKRSGSPDSIKSSQSSASDKDNSKKQHKQRNKDKNDSEAGSSPRDKKPVTEDDLEDDEAIYKRHVARLAVTKSVKTTTPIRVTDVIRKSEAVHMDNEHLRTEVQRLKWDNAQLLLQAKHSREEKDKLLHNIGTSEIARQDLQKRLEKEKTQHYKLQRSLTRQASEWIQLRKESYEAEESRRWANVGAIAPYNSDGRAKHPPKRNVDKPRKMYPVEEYDKSGKKQ